MREVLQEKQVFRIDHYLGKPSVQNLFALRFGNALFEPIWRREHIANIQITIAEDLGVEKRGAFYDQTGALRDMVQNHALQLLCAIGMEPPINAHADAIRDEKLKVLRALKRWTPATLETDVVRGQHGAGLNGGPPLAAYRDEPGVAPMSNTETFVALRTEIQNWRWAGVPFYIRTGKRMAAHDAHIAINFNPTPHAIFQAPRGMANRLLINLQPRDGLELHLLAQGQSQRRSADAATGARAARSGLRQALRRRAGRRLRAAVARRIGRAAEPVRAQRRARRSVALGGADSGELADGGAQPAQLRVRHLGAKRGERIDRARRVQLERGTLNRTAHSAQRTASRISAAAAAAAAGGSFASDIRSLHGRIGFSSKQKAPR